MIKNINARTGRICVGNAQNPESASLDGTDLYAYAYDAVGNRVSATETTNSWAYAANALNQYTLIVGNNDGTFIPEYDGDGNQTLVKTETGVWRVAYNGENRPVAWSNGTTAVEMAYDDTGRRRAKRVSPPGAEVLHAFLYDGYLLIAESAVSNGVPLTPVNYVWDPAENIATRALCSISGTNVLFHTHDLTKNVWELLDAGGNIVATYGYAPFGPPALASGGTGNRVGWSSECADPDSGCVSYLFRGYEGHCGRWQTRDLLGEYMGYNLYSYLENSPVSIFDVWGMSGCSCKQSDINKTAIEYLESAARMARNVKKRLRDRNIGSYTFEFCAIICCNTNTGEVAGLGPMQGNFRNKRGEYDDNPDGGVGTCGEAFRKLQCNSEEVLVMQLHTHPEDSESPCFSNGDLRSASYSCVPLALRNSGIQSKIVVCCPDGKCREINSETGEAKVIPCPRRRQ